jgi:hypothetical protein
MSKEKQSGNCKNCNSHEKQQIEEMANILWHIPHGYSLNSYNDCEIIAECIYNDGGYRKQSEGENISQMHTSDEFICEKCGLIIRECCRYEIDEDDGDEICYEFPYRFCPRCGMKVKGGAG